MNARKAAWPLRLLLGALLLWGSETLLWANPNHRTPDEWILLAAGYLLLAAMILDLAARYRVRDLYDVMALLAIAALLNGLLLNPHTALVDFPRTLVTRILGGYGLISLEMFGLFLILTSGRRRRGRSVFFGFSIAVGFFWGIWARWSPELTDRMIDPSIPLSLLFGYLAAGIVICGTLFVWMMRSSSQLALSDLLLKRRELAGVMAAAAGFIIFRFFQPATDIGIWAIFGALIGLCYAVMWFRRKNTGKTVLDPSMPPFPPRTRLLLIALLIFVIMTILGYSLPFFEVIGIHQLGLVELAFAGVGFLWLPVIALVISFRALDRQARTGKLD